MSVMQMQWACPITVKKNKTIRKENNSLSKAGQDAINSEQKKLIN